MPEGCGLLEWLGDRTPPQSDMAPIYYIIEKCYSEYGLCGALRIQTWNRFEEVISNCPKRHSLISL